MAAFGLQGFPRAPDGVDLLAHYRSVLEMVPSEFTSVWIQDHLQKEGHAKDLLESWVLISHLATEFPRFLFSHLVMGQSFRNPALVAKMAATLQYVTGGRFVLSMGAGWLEDEYRAYNYEYPSGATRVEQLAEAVQLIRAMWAESPATFEGKHYRIEDAYLDVPEFSPIPIMIGTNGRKALAVTARHADWWNWDAPWEPTFREPYERLKAACDASGRPIDEITLTAGAIVYLPDNVDDFVPQYFHGYYSAWFPILGPTPADVTREIETLVDIGVQHFPISFVDMSSLHRFIDEVVPSVRLTPRTATKETTTKRAAP